jgi:hypothetical protein
VLTLPASSVIASSLAAAPIPAAEPIAPEPANGRAPVRALNVSGLYKFNFGGHNGWLLLKHYPGPNRLLAWVHYDGQTKRVGLRSWYDPSRRLVRLTRVDNGYRFEYFLWAAQKSPKHELHFAGYLDAYPLRRASAGTRLAPTYEAAEQAGASLHYVADDAD